jgi:hypothetical protein
MDVEQGELGPPSGHSTAEVAVCLPGSLALGSQHAGHKCGGAGGSEARSLGAPRVSYLLQGEGHTGGLGREEGPRDGPAGGPFFA